MEIKKTYKRFIDRFNRDTMDIPQERNGLHKGLVLDFKQGLVKDLGLRVGVFPWDKKKLGIYHHLVANTKVFPKHNK